MIEKTRLEQELESSELRYTKSKRNIFFHLNAKSKTDTPAQVDKTKLEQELEGSEQNYTKSKNKMGILYLSLVLLTIASMGWYMYFMERNELKEVKEQLSTVTARCELPKQAKR
ncbi:MAG: hypothetical protein HQL03_04090 [Nitrospirae bacterium]|nr:hypothetical protein [Nitrospirota bacterium]MBF0592015.1 hypothetical protein [Nitrospirota bacterium]